MADYCKLDLESALLECGVSEGQVVFCHSNIGFFGRASDASTSDEVCELVRDAFRSVLGRTGTLVVPTFSYSFGSEKAEKLFVPAISPSVCGTLSEHVRRLRFSCRSYDPMFSVAAVGARAEEMTSDVGLECFGEQSFWGRFLRANGIIVNLNLDAGSTFIHFVERRLGVSYRENRLLAGTLVIDGVPQACEAVYFSRRLDDSSAVPSFEKFDKAARQRGYARTGSVGRGAVVAISAANTVRLINEMLPQDSSFLTKAVVTNLI